jgi:hypothetical protein
MQMYFGIKWFGDGWSEYIKTKEYLLTFPFETTGESSVLKLDLKDLRRLKIQSLGDKKIKKELEELQKLLNDDTKIHVYGNEMPKFESMSTGTGGYAGSTGSIGISGESKSSGIKEEFENYLSVINEIFNSEFLTENNLFLDIQNEEIVLRD